MKYNCTVMKTNETGISFKGYTRRIKATSPSAAATKFIDKFDDDYHGANWNIVNGDIATVRISYGNITVYYKCTGKSIFNYYSEEITKKDAL